MILRENLPEAQFCDIDTATVEAELIAAYENITGRTLYPGNPERLFVEGVAYLVAQQRYLIDNAGKMNLLHYSRDAYLDHLGDYLNTFRLGERAASTTLRFSLAEPLAWEVIIPQGVRARAGGEDALMWVTTAEAKIPAGEISVDVEAGCQTPGAAANGLVPGQIHRLVDGVTYVQGVVNLTLTLGGTDAETDANLRARVQLAAEAYSTCGPEDAYRYWARSVSQLISDVAVWSPSPGEVWIAPLMAGGELPSAEIINAVDAAVNDVRRRPLTDVVHVVSPEVAPCEVALTYYILQSHATRTLAIQAAVAKEVAAYVAWQREALGRAILPSVLVDRVQSVPGVQRVEVTAPEYQALEPRQVAAPGAPVLTYGGLSGQ
ncbi:MAG: baseplate J/gp47 family protein [Deltaproteobacteria bacterium]|nr:baseplate J/gp47 family protein [Deltaproteobacteria bacterium]